MLCYEEALWLCALLRGRTTEEMEKVLEDEKINPRDYLRFVLIPDVILGEEEEPKNLLAGALVNFL